MKKKSQIQPISWLFCIFFFCLSAKALAQYDIPDKPSLETSVYEIGTTVLSATQKNNLEQKLIQYSDTTSTQMVVVIIPSTQGEDISFLGAKWGQKWGIGQEGKDNGILITLAKDDRRIDINTGYGIETVVTDRMAEQIINRIMIPEFKQGNYYAGLDRGTNALFLALQGEYEGTRETTNNINIGRILPIIIFFIIVIIILSRSRNNGGRGGRGGRSTAGSILDAIILSNMGRGSWGGSSGGGSFGGGGFGGGFGGGGFGGGGASGGW